MSEAIEQLKANLPTHPPVDSIKPLEEDYTGLRILAVHAHPDDESSRVPVPPRRILPVVPASWWRR